MTDGFVQLARNRLITTVHIVNPISALRSFFLLAAATILFINSVPALRQRFLQYGSRTAPPISKKDGKSAASKQETDSLKLEHASFIPWVLDRLNEYQVPHQWFLHFYVASVVCSLFWTLNAYYNTALIPFVAHYSVTPALSSTPEESWSSRQLRYAPTLMLVQGCRRLFESWLFLKSSNSRMWVVHWLLGLAFYVLMSVAVWIEASPILRIGPNALSFTCFEGDFFAFLLTPSGMLFTSASAMQSWAHYHLSTLKKYSLPSNTLFRHVVCPHYSLECLVYLSLARVAAPPGSSLNTTVTCALVFVTVNLGVTARDTKRWYAQRFGEDSVRGKWAIVPGLW